MANTIGINSKSCGRGLLQMSNGLTDVFVNVLVLSGSALAKTVSEKRLIVWLAEKDQSRVGAGTVDFDLWEMPWDSNTFEEDRAFLLRVVSGAKERLGWEKLDYRPNEDMLFLCLDHFSELISGLAQIQPGALEEWLAESDPSDPVMSGFPRCSRHQTLLSIFGCHICNN